MAGSDRPPSSGPPPLTPEEKIDAILAHQRTISSEVHEVVKRLGDIERWKEDQELRSRRSVSELELKDEVVVAHVAGVDERVGKLQSVVEHLVELQKQSIRIQEMTVDTNEKQTEAVNSLRVTASQAPVIEKLRKRLPGYVIIATILATILGAFLHTLMTELGKGH